MAIVDCFQAEDIADDLMSLSCGKQVTFYFGLFSFREDAGNTEEMSYECWLDVTDFCKVFPYVNFPSLDGWDS